MNRKAFLRLSIAGTGALLGSTRLNLAAGAVSEPTSQADAGVNATIAASDLVSRMTSRPSRSRRAQIEKLINTLMSCGVWYQLDCLYIFAAHHVQAARLNWVRNSQDLTSVNAPLFRIDRGFAGDGASSFLDLNIGAISLERFLANDATMGVYALRGAAASTQIDIGFTGSYLNFAADDGRPRIRANSTDVDPTTIPEGSDSVGLLAWSRRDSHLRVYRNGSLVLSKPVSTGRVADRPVTILKVDSNYSARQVSAAFLGGGLTDRQHAQLNIALTEYLKSVMTSARGPT